MKNIAKNITKGIKERIKYQRNISNIKRKAYEDEMKKQAEKMGKKQAMLEAKYREKAYSSKLKSNFNRRISLGSANVFGFGDRDEKKRNKKYFNPITGM